MLAVNQPMPLPALPSITTRVATMDDLAFIDALQKKHSKQLGFFPRAQIEGYLKNGWMRVAEEVTSCELRVAREDGTEVSSLGTRNSELATPRPIGYVAFRDRYQKRDELGAVFQLCVEPGRQRGLIGATLLQSAFDASAYGCKLFCCWCAQDLAANRFWEAMGFQAIAFRAGSEKKSRVHLFWQKRIRAGDAATPWWYPSGTDGGAMRSGRIVLPIPHGTHWSDVRPMTFDGEVGGGQLAVGSEEKKRRRRLPTVHRPLPTRPAHVMPGGFWFAPPAPAETAAIVEAPVKRERAKTDPRLIAASRELRDRWLEQVNASPTTGAGGKYAVARQIEGDVVDGEVVEPTRLLAA